MNTEPRYFPGVSVFPNAPDCNNETPLDRCAWLAMAGILADHCDIDRVDGQSYERSVALLAYRQAKEMMAVKKEMQQ